MSDVGIAHLGVESHTGETAAATRLITQCDARRRPTGLRITRVVPNLTAARVSIPSECVGSCLLRHWHNILMWLLEVLKRRTRRIVVATYVTRPVLDTPGMHMHKKSASKLWQ